MFWHLHQSSSFLIKTPSKCAPFARSKTSIHMALNIKSIFAAEIFAERKIWNVFIYWIFRAIKMFAIVLNIIFSLSSLEQQTKFLQLRSISFEIRLNMKCWKIEWALRVIAGMSKRTFGTVRNFIELLRLLKSWKLGYRSIDFDKKQKISYRHFLSVFSKFPNVLSPKTREKKISSVCLDGRLHDNSQTKATIKLKFTTDAYINQE